MTITITADMEYNADEFWCELGKQFPHVAKALRDEGVSIVSVETWEAIQKLDGFADGPHYARHALFVVGDATC